MALTSLVRDRTALLRLLGVVPKAALAGLTVAMLMASLLPAATAVAVGWLVGRVVESTEQGASLGSVTAPLVLVGLLLTLDQVTQSLLVPFRNWMAARVNGAIRQTVRQAVAVRPGVDHLESQVVRDAAALPIENAYLFNLGAGAEGQLWLMTRFVGALVSAAVVARYSWLAAIAVFVFIAWQRSLLRRHYAGAIASGMVDTISDGRAAAYWSEILGTERGAKEVRLFGFREWAITRFYDHGKRPVEELSRVLLGAQRLHWKIFVLNGMAALVPFLLLARLAVNDGISAVGLATALGGVVAVSRVLGGMGFEAFSIESSVPQLEAVERLRTFHSNEQELASARTGAATPDAVPHISFENVTFGYPETDVPVLRDLDLEVFPGQSVAIVGENGAGKTTLPKLLAGFYQPTSGRIMIDGQDLTTIDPAEWRHRLAVIFQEFTRFELSVLENITLAGPDHPDRIELARSAAEAADAADIIDGLPFGWDTILARGFTNGAELSGGQWQRIALARALYGAKVGGQVLILDEPTASLDVHAEVALFDQLLAHASGCTAMVVSHRYSTVRRANRIIVLADGRVAEDGSHDELMAELGQYARLYELQAQRFRDDGNQGDVVVAELEA